MKEPGILKKMKSMRAALVLLLLLVFTGAAAAAPGALLPPCYGVTLSADEMAAAAVDFIHGQYQGGENIDGYAAYVLDLAGEDLAAEKWAAGGRTLKSRMEHLAGLLGDNNSLITYITATQNPDGSFGPYANAYGTKAPLQALAAVKADTAGAAVYAQVNNAIARAVAYYQNGFQSGEMPYEATGWTFDYRCVEALVAAGADLASDGWTTAGGGSLKEAVIASAGAAAANPAARDAVSLAKELTALHAVDPAADDIGRLADAIIAKADTSVPGQIFFGNSIYDDVMVLTALGKAGRLADLDQRRAFAYLNTYKMPHLDMWGAPAGAAWGSAANPEPDLTAQVLTALSYFDAVNNQGSSVYQAAQDGLAYLAGIQDLDTAAISAEWDSTFATAETLIALKSLGKTYGEYAGGASPWLKKSRTKTVAQCLLALSQWPDNADRRDQLAALLAGRQVAGGRAAAGAGSFENSVYSDMWALIALGEAGKTGGIDTAAAKDYILAKQGADGSWGEVFDDTFYADFLSTTQAIRALTYLPGMPDAQAQAAIERGLAYLKSMQQEDGGVYNAWDDPAVDNSELIITLSRLGQDPAAAVWKNAAGLSPVDYLLHRTMNADGSFGATGNVFGAAEALAAYLLVKTPGHGSGGGDPPPVEEETCRVQIAVVGMNGELLYGPGRVTVQADDQWGITALGALHATGLDYYADRDTGFVRQIEGQANSGMDGWMFKVNGEVAAAAGKDVRLGAGDQVIWWYSESIDSSGPDWNSLESGNIVARETTGAAAALPSALRPAAAALAAMEKLDQLLSVGNGTALAGLDQTARAVVVTGEETRPAWTEFLARTRELAGNTIDLAEKIEAEEDTVLSDQRHEIGLLVPGGALDRDEKVTITKNGAAAAGSGVPGTPPAGWRLVSPVYRLGPENARLDTPATLVLQVAVPPLVKTENLVLARYDQEQETWRTVLAVVDAGKQLIAAPVSELAAYAVWARVERKSFADVSAANAAWALEPVESLAGAGVLQGTGGSHFEPDRPVTRAELAGILARALRLPAAGSETCFSDVQETAWYAAAVAAAARAGLVNGYEDGAYRPERTITREEMAAVLTRVAATPDQLPAAAGLPFSDAAAVSPWAAESLTAAVAAGRLTGYPDGTLRPQGTVTRAECAVMVYRTLTAY